MKKIIITVLVLLVLAAVIYFGSGRLEDLDGANGSPRVVVDGTEWVEVLSWDFADGEYPQGWGWGEWEIVDGTLELTDPDGNSAVYFLPVPHGGDFLIETEVQLVRGDNQREAAAHLITRDDSRIMHETGMVIIGGGRTAFVRHTVGGKDYALEFVNAGTTIAYGDWHVLRLTVLEGNVTAYVDDLNVHIDYGPKTVAPYNEPHLAVEDGTARFGNLKVYTLPGFRKPANTAGPFVPPPPAEERAADEDDEDAAAAAAVSEGPQRPWWVRVLLYIFYAVIALVCVYMVRHYTFTLNRLFGRQRHPYLDVDEADWPEVTVLVPAHNEEAVIGDVLGALLEVDYPRERLRVLAINDRSEDRTGEIIDELAAKHPDLITPFHRKEGTAGKAAALQDAMDLVEDDIVLVFDADYIPGHGLIKQLVAPFFDPEVGAVMGRVVPHNVAQNLLTRVLDLERAGGYQVDQQARMNMGLVPQYGGTVGGVRREALLAAGGWRLDSLAEDTDATFRLLLAGWKTVYQNRSECYEQVPETWGMRMRQILRWARGHNQAMARYARRVLFNRRTGFMERLDGFLLLHVYMMSAILLLGWGVGIVLWYLGVSKPGLIVILLVACYSTLGNFAIFYEIATAAYLDGSRHRIRLLPFIFLGFLVSLVSVTRATITQIVYRPRSDDVLWHKTEHNGRGRAWT